MNQLIDDYPQCQGHRLELKDTNVLLQESKSMSTYVYRHTRTGHELSITSDAGFETVIRALVQLKGKEAMDYELVAVQRE